MKKEEESEGFYKIPEQIESILETIRSSAEDILDEIIPLQMEMQRAKESAGIKADAQG